jgi:BMFP domain-containing protein YqiC
MIDTSYMDELAHRLSQTVPSGLKGMRAELESNFRAILQANLSKLDLVSREQFDASQALLASTRAKLDRLEAQVAALEKQNAKPATRKKTVPTNRAQTSDKTQNKQST